MNPQYKKTANYSSLLSDLKSNILEKQKGRNISPLNIRKTPTHHANKSFSGIHYSEATTVNNNIINSNNNHTVLNNNIYNNNQKSNVNDYSSNDKKDSNFFNTTSINKQMSTFNTYKTSVVQKPIIESNLNFFIFRR